MEVEDDLVNLRTESDVDQNSPKGSFVTNTDESKNNVLMNSSQIFKNAMGSMAASSQASHCQYRIGTNSEAPDNLQSSHEITPKQYKREETGTLDLPTTAGIIEEDNETESNRVSSAAGGGKDMTPRSSQTAGDGGSAASVKLSELLNTKPLP